MVEQCTELRPCGYEYTFVSLEKKWRVTGGGYEVAGDRWRVRSGR